jgi:hypothetical protein
MIALAAIALGAMLLFGLPVKIAGALLVLCGFLTMVLQ